MMRKRTVLTMLLVLVLAVAVSAEDPVPSPVGAFDFGPTVGGIALPGYTQVLAGAAGTAPIYNATDGYGYLAAGIVEGIDCPVLAAWGPLEDCHSLHDETFRMDFANDDYTFEAWGGIYPEFPGTAASYIYLEISGDGGSTWTKFGRNTTTGLPMPNTYYAFDGYIPDVAAMDVPNATYPQAYDTPAGYAWHVNNAPISVTAGYILVTGLDDSSDPQFTALCGINVIPEPTTMALMGVGIATLLAKRKRA